MKYDETYLSTKTYDALREYARDLVMQLREAQDYDGDGYEDPYDSLCARLREVRKVIHQQWSAQQQWLAWPQSGESK